MSFAVSIALRSDSFGGREVSTLSCLHCPHCPRLSSIGTSSRLSTGLEVNWPLTAYKTLPLPSLDNEHVKNERGIVCECPRARRESVRWLRWAAPNSGPAMDLVRFRHLIGPLLGANTPPIWLMIHSRPLFSSSHGASRRSGPSSMSTRSRRASSESVAMARRARSRRPAGRRLELGGTGNSTLSAASGPCRQQLARLRMAVAVQSQLGQKEEGVEHDQQLVSTTWPNR